MLVHFDPSPYHATIPLEVAHPIRIAEHKIGTAVRSVLIRRMEEPAEIRSNPQHVEVVSARLIQPRRRGLATSVQTRTRESVCDDPIKAAVPIAQIEIIRIRVDRRRIFAVLDGKQPLLIRAHSADAESVHSAH